MLLFCLTGLLLCGSVLSQDPPLWNYNQTSEEGPSHWGQSYPACYGASQSPVNLNTTVVSRDIAYGSLSFVNYNVVPGSDYVIFNTGHGVQINMPDKTRTFNGEGLRGPYTLEQLHFHWSQETGHGSEHTVDGVGHSVEIHLVHYDASLYPSVSAASSVGDSGGVAVIAVFVDVNTVNLSAALGVLTTSLPLITQNGENTTTPSFAIQDLLPAGRNYLRYQGGLTTPGCAESVMWTVMTEPIFITQQQLAQFRLIYDAHGELIETNCRPVQQVNTRMTFRGGVTIITSSASSTSLLSVFMLTLFFQFCYLFRS